MKKLLIATMIASAIVANTVSADPTEYKGAYIQGDFGYSSIDMDSGYKNIDFPKKTVPTARLSIGSYFKNGRVAIDYTHFKKVSSDVNSNVLKGNMELSIKSFGLSWLYDFNIENNFMPYLGIRLAYNKGKADFKTTNGIFSNVKVNSIDSGIGYGALAGIQYKLNKNVYINLGTEYNVLFSDVHQFGGNLGVRVNF